MLRISQMLLQSLPPPSGVAAAEWICCEPAGVFRNTKLYNSLQLMIINCKGGVNQIHSTFQFEGWLLILFYSTMALFASREFAYKQLISSSINWHSSHNKCMEKNIKSWSLKINYNNFCRVWISKCVFKIFCWFWLSLKFWKFEIGEKLWNKACKISQPQLILSQCELIGLWLSRPSGPWPGTPIMTWHSRLRPHQPLPHLLGAWNGSL